MLWSTCSRATYYWQVVRRFVLQALCKIQIKVDDVLKIHPQLSCMAVQGVPARHATLSLSDTEEEEKSITPCTSPACRSVIALSIQLAIHTSCKVPLRLLHLNTYLRPSIAPAVSILCNKINGNGPAGQCWQSNYSPDGSRIPAAIQLLLLQDIVELGKGCRSTYCRTGIIFLELIALVVVIDCALCEHPRACEATSAQCMCESTPKA